MLGVLSKAAKSAVLAVLVFMLMAIVGSTAAAAACTPGGSTPSVTICSPASTSGSPIRITAAAKSNTTVKSMTVWLDGAKQNQVNGSSVDMSIPVANGAHRVTVQAKDANGNLFSQTAYTTVGASCAAGNTVPSVTICSPTGTSSSPIQVSATARSSTYVNYMAVWLDGAKQYQVNAGAVDTSIAAGNGTHRITVQARDANGQLFSNSVNTTVGNSGPTTWSISGTITPASSGAGARVTLSGGKSASTTADANGRYSFTGLSNASYTVTPSGSGVTFSPVQATVTVNGGNVSNTNFTASTSSSGHSVDLSWNPSSSSTVSGYKVYRATTSGGPYSSLNSSPVTSTLYTDMKVSAGGKYYYVVTAVDSRGAESSYSNQVAATVPTP